MPFNDSLELILGFEGGLVNDPDDAGGKTNKGITQNTYNNYRQKLHLPPNDVANISSEEVTAIYSGIWTSCYADKIDVISSSMATAVFDFAVNSGSVTAVKTLQKTIGVTQDGIYGPITEKQLKNELRDFGQSQILKLFAFERITFYERLAIRRPVDKKFLSSWISRTLVTAGVKL